MRAAILTLMLAFPGLADAAKCTGADACKACKDCSACWYCSPKNPKGGSCGTLRDQSAAQRAKAERKRR